MTRLFTPRSIGQRFALAIGTAAGGILIVLAVANFLNGRELLLDQASREAGKEASNQMGNWDDLVERIAIYPTLISSTQLDTADRGGVTLHWLASLLNTCPIPAVYALYMRLDDSDWQKPGRGVNRKNTPKPIQLRYDFHDPDQDWYRGAKEKKGIYVTLPYFDEGGSDIDMISITKAVHDPSGKFIGVAGADVSMEEMEKIIREMDLRGFSANLFGREKVTSALRRQKIEPGANRGSAYLISGNGAVIIASGDRLGKRAPKTCDKDKDKIMGSLSDHGLQLTSVHLHEILSSSSGWMHIRENGDKMVCWAESRTTGWKLVLAFPYSMIISPARHLAEESLLIGGVGLLMLLGVVFYVAGRVAKPIRDLQKVTGSFREGFYERGGEILSSIQKRQDELGEFASGFALMAGEIRLREKRLSDWNSNLERTVSERTEDLAKAMEKVERSNRSMAAELAQAASYSRAVLPPKMDGNVKTDWIFEASSQLGGDSFGYHWLDKDHLSFYLLDVCGHGVGAALLATSVVNVLRTTSLPETDFHDPAAVLRTLNYSFPMEQNNEMFFTAWYGVYSRSKEEIRFACGGHPPPILIKEGGERVLLTAKGSVVGVFPNTEYEVRVCKASPGSILYLFSDGVYEIDRPDGKMMSYDEFSDLIAGINRGSLESILKEIHRLHGSELLEDDFSIVSFEFL